MAADDDDFVFTKAAALTQLVDEILSKAELREQFLKDPVALANEKDIDLGNIPERVLKTLTGLSVDELRLLDELNRVFKEEGMAVKTGSSLMVY